MLARVVDALIRARGTTLLVVLVMSTVCGWGLARLRFAASTEIWLHEEAPARRTYERWREAFGTQQHIVVGVFADDVYAPATLDGIERLSEAVQGLPFVRRVRSLTRIRMFNSPEPDVVDIEPVVPRVPVPPDDVANIRRRTAQDRIHRAFFVSPDGRATALLVELTSADVASARGLRALKALRSTINAHAPADADVRLAGPAIVEGALYRRALEDLTRIGGAAAVVTALLTLVTFRSVLIAALPLVVVSVSTLWVFGLMGGLGLPADLLSQSLLALLFVTGVSAAILVLGEYRRRIQETDDAGRALHKAVSRSVAPCTLMTASAAAGLLPLTLSDVAPVARLAWLALLGTFLALGLSLTLLPALLFWLPTPPRTVVLRSRWGPLVPVFDRIATITEYRRWTALLLFGACMVASLVALPRLGVESNPLRFLPAQHPARADTRTVEAAFGTATLELLVEASPGQLRSYPALLRLQEVVNVLERRMPAARVSSVTDGLVSLNEAMTGAAEIPADPDTIAQSIQLLEEEPDLDPMVNATADLATVSARVPMTGVQRGSPDLEGIEAELRGSLAGSGLTVRPTGFVAHVASLGAALSATHLRSFSIAWILTGLVAFARLRSVAMALVAVAAHTGPVLIGLGLMRVIDLPIDPGTVMLASITLGLSVDGTVVLMIRVQRRRRDGLNWAEATQAAVREAGRQLLEKRLIWAIGLGLLGMGRLWPNVHFGAMAAIVFCLALTADLVVVPAALVTLRPEDARDPA